MKRKASYLIRAPFPWFGGKSRVAHLVWQRFGDVRNYVEPFAGSLAVLLARPFDPKVETVNDRDCYLANFWRAVQHDPEAVAHFADWPVNEADLHARHRWLVTTARERAERVMSEPEFYDTQIAGWWVWGQCLWIGSGWCSSAGARRANGARRSEHWKARPDLSAANGRGGAVVESVWKKRPVLGKGGRGIAATTHHEDADVARKRPALTQQGNGVGVHRVGLSLPRNIVDLSGDSGAVGRGIVASGFARRTGGLYTYLQALADRLRRVRVCCGDWSRVLGPAVTTCIGTTGVFLDPPYHAPGDERSVCYTHDDADIWHAVREWAVANGDNPELRIALCGYEGAGAMPETWAEVAWKAGGGYGRSARGRANRERERIWFSPHCLTPAIEQHELAIGGGA